MKYTESQLEQAFISLLETEGYAYFNGKEIARASNQEVLLRDELRVFLQQQYSDWRERDDIKAQLKMDIIVKLHEYGYPPITQEDVYKNVLEQAENFKKNK